MTLKASIIMTCVAIVFLFIYGADAVIGQGTNMGFLPIDHQVRGVLLGIPSVILPIVSYFITRKQPSKILGILIIASGLITVIGSAAFLGMQSSEIDNVRLSEFGPVIGIGIFIIILGVIKIKKSIR